MVEASFWELEGYVTSNVPWKSSFFLEFAHVLASNRENELLFADQAQMNWLQELARQKPA